MLINLVVLYLHRSIGSRTCHMECCQLPRLASCHINPYGISLSLRHISLVKRSRYANMDQLVRCFTHYNLSQ